MPNPLENERRVRALNRWAGENLGLDYLKDKKDELMQNVDSGIQEHIVNPITEAGYPNVGAGIGTAISTPLQAISDQIPTTLPDIGMAMVPVPGMKLEGKATRAIFTPQQEEQIITKLAKMHPGQPDIINAKLAAMEKQAADKIKGAYHGDVGGIKSKDAQAALTYKPKQDNIVHDASSTAQLPVAQESAKRYMSTAEEQVRRSALAKAAAK